MAVVNWNTPTRRPRKGLLTHWLAGLEPTGHRHDAAGAIRVDDITSHSQVLTARVPLWTERGALRLPPAHSTPVLMVGPGTGVAPFRSFCWHRAAIKQQQQQQQPAVVQEDPVAGSSLLFFGCRSPDADFYYRQEWLQLMQQGALHDRHGLIAAFSRHQPQPDQQQLLEILQVARQDRIDGHTGLPEQPINSSKVYVTHKLRQHGAHVWQLLSEQGAWVYVSGSAEKMPANVVSALEEVAMVHGGMSAEAAARYIRQLELTGRYHVEAWS